MVSASVRAARCDQKYPRIVFSLPKRRRAGDGLNTHPCPVTLTQARARTHPHSFPLTAIPIAAPINFEGRAGYFTSTPVQK